MRRIVRALDRAIAADGLRRAARAPDAGTTRPMRRLSRELAPYHVVQWIVLALVIAAPQVVWQRNPVELASAGSEDAGRDARMEQLQKVDDESTPTPDPAPTARP